MKKKKFSLLDEVRGQNGGRPEKLAIASGLYLPLFKPDRQFILKRMLPESVESVVADLVGLEHVVDGGHWVVGR